MKAVPSGMTTTGSGRFGVTSASRAAPSGESASEKRWGYAQRSRTERLDPSRPRVAHDVDGMGRDALVLGPLEQEARDRLVEGLVRRRERAYLRSGRCVRGRSPRRWRRPWPSRPTPPSRSEGRASRAGAGGAHRRGAPGWSHGQNGRREHERDRCPVLGDARAGSLPPSRRRGTRPRSRARTARGALGARDWTEGYGSVRQRSRQSACGGGAGQPGQGRLRARALDASQRRVPLPVRRAVHRGAARLRASRRCAIAEVLREAAATMQQAAFEAAGNQAAEGSSPAATIRLCRRLPTVPARRRRPVSPNISDP